MGSTNSTGRMCRRRDSIPVECTKPTKQIGNHNGGTRNTPMSQWHRGTALHCTPARTASQGRIHKRVMHHVAGAAIHSRDTNTHSRPACWLRSTHGLLPNAHQEASLRICHHQQQYSEEEQQHTEVHTPPPSQAKMMCEPKSPRFRATHGGAAFAIRCGGWRRCSQCVTQVYLWCRDLDRSTRRPRGCRGCTWQQVYAQTASTWCWSGL